MSVAERMADQQEDVRGFMVDYIRKHFSHMLGDHAQLLDSDEGIDRLSELVRSGRLGQ